MPTSARMSFAHEFPVVVANSPASSTDRRIALGIVAVLFAVATAITPIANVQLARQDAFVPALQAALCAAELITALFLLGQYRVRPQYALLALVSGYMVSGLFAFLHSLTFPGAYAPAGLFGGPDTGAWLYCFWHIGFPLSVIAYLTLRDRDGDEPRDRSPLRTICLVVGLTLAAIVAVTWAVSAGASFLPALYQADLKTQMPFTSYLTGAILLLTLTAFALTFWRARSTLDWWLLVALFTALPDLLLPTVLPAPRFTVAWYVARGYALITSFAVLSLLLFELMSLYQRLAASVVLARRERANRMMSLDVATSAIVHEMRQPLNAIASTGDAAAGWLARQPPNLDEARENLASIVANAHRADAILKVVRNVFQESTDQQPICLEDVAEQALRLLQHDLQTNHVLVQKEYAPGRLPVMADAMQLQQVALNLIKNAIDAMDVLSASARRLRVATRHGKDSVILWIEDSGPGIPDKLRERIFDPFFTTKASGMGLGLSICRQIVEAHEGSLVLAESRAGGTTFQIEFPVMSATAE